MGNSKHKNKNFLSVEIGSRFLKTAYIVNSKGQDELKDFIFEDIEGLPDDEIAGKIKGFALKNKIKKCPALSIIPANSVIAKNIEIPSIDKKEIKDIIDLQAGRHTPYSREEIIMDYSEIGVFHERYTKILLTIVRRDFVSKRYEIIEKAGFKAETAVFSAESVSRWAAGNFPEESGSSPSGIIHIDTEYTDFILHNKGQVIYLRPIPAGAYNFSVNGEDAYVVFLEEIKKSLESYQSENIDALPEKFICFSPEGIIQDKLDDLKQKLNINIELRPVSAGIVSEIQSQDSGSGYPSLLSVISAPLVYSQLSLNLIPEDVKMKREIRNKARHITALGVLSMAVLILFCAGLLTKMFFKRLYLEKLMSSYTSEDKEAQGLKEISERTKVMRDFLHRKGSVLEVMVNLIQSIPEEIYLNSLIIKEDNTITFTGTADIMSRVFSLVTDLEGKKYFKNVKVDFTKTRRVKGKEVSDFGLTLSLE